ncbi:MAG: 4Fe-4S dicluster domain-containing protein [Bacteroides sp.]|nr:4Fe-4S dicluster domain-containing protein [Prevotella sp.]MCM1407923.1 4Fe-4S dicluster domain-containing protein [Treponema brennaborense]MCM1469665.1 4Fe-4S dicluster domain-containing protein [Bacteroides sp.]
MIRADAIENMTETCEKTISSFLPPEASVLFCQDGTHVLTPIVKKGNYVTEGQIIAFDAGGTEAAVHSPVPGQVVDCFSAADVSGKMVSAAKIRLSGSFSFLGKKRADLNWMFLSSEQRCRQMTEMGVINTFREPRSLGEELQQRTVPRNQVLVVRLYDPEPDCSVDSFIAEHYQKSVFEGAAIIADTMNARFVVFLYAENNIILPEEKTMQDLFKTAQTVFVPMSVSKYPCGTVRAIIRSIKNYARKKHISTLPADITTHDVFIDSATALSVHDALVGGVPVIERIVQISGEPLASGGMFRVKIGTPIRNLLEECGLMPHSDVKVIVNGMLGGFDVCDIDAPVTKRVKSISVVPVRSPSDLAQSDCMRCGYCRGVCPNGLHPESIYADYKENRSLPEMTETSIRLCSQCGLCSAVCPSRIPLHQIIKLLKGQL